MLHPETFSISRLLQSADIRLWLIGGQATELVRGSLVCGSGHEQGLRLHEDMDFFVHADDAACAVNLLGAAGFVYAHGSLKDGDLFLKRSDLLLDMVQILPAPPRTLGALAGILWPVELLTSHVVRGVPTLTPAMQLAMKRAVSQFYGLPLRPKDLLDAAALNALLA